MVDPAATSGAEVLALPSSGAVLPDARGEGRWMRVTWHEEADVVVLSLWRQSSCVGTLRLDPGQVPDLVSALVEGLAGSRVPATAQPANSGGARGGS